MSTIPPRMRRLAAELKMMQELKQESSLFDFQAEPSDYPNKYFIQYNCLGLADRPDISGPLPHNWRQLTYSWLRHQHTASILLPANYPDRPPRIILHQPVFHPNIKSLNEIQQELAEVVQRAGGQEVFERLLENRPELREEVAQHGQIGVCIDWIFPSEIGGNYYEGIRIRDICIELGKMLMFRQYNLVHGLNPEAQKWTEWAEKQANLLPIDSRDFLDKRPVMVRVLASDDEIGEITIEEQS